MNTLTNHHALSIVVPFRNERSLVSAMVAAHGQLQSSVIEFIYVDDGSTDGSGEELRRLDSKATIVRLEGAGTGKAFLAGASKAQGAYILLLPIDCVISRAGIDELLLANSEDKAGVLLFPKKYAGTETMSPYASLQNLILLKAVKLASWTNGFVFHRRLIGALKLAVKEDFLNDLEFSRNLRTEKWHVLENEISVSARRYEKDGAWRRILINGLILLLWQLKLASTQRLHQIYKRGKSD